MKKPETRVVDGVPSQKVGRLALREEGANWNAYYVLPDTMKGAIYLGGIALRFVDARRSKPEFVTRTNNRREAFIVMMREAVGDLIEELHGVRPTWPEGVQPAPEHERTRKA